MTDATAQQLQLECQKCGAWYPAKISGEVLETLEDAGIDPDEIAAAVDLGLASWQLLCDPCSATAAN